MATQCTPSGLSAIPSSSDSTTNLIQANNAVTTTPTPILMQIVQGNDAQNPYKIPAYLAQSELLTRTQMAKVAQQVQQPAPQQATPSMVNPAQAPRGVNPMAAPTMANPAQAPNGANPMAQQQMANPQQGLMALPAKAPSSGIASVPMGMFNSQSYAGGGIVAFSGLGEYGSRVPSPGSWDRNGPVGDFVDFLKSTRATPPDTGCSPMVMSTNPVGAAYLTRRQQGNLTAIAPGRDNTLGQNFELIPKQDLSALYASDNSQQDAPAATPAATSTPIAAPALPTQEGFAPDTVSKQAGIASIAPTQEGFAPDTVSKQAGIVTVAPPATPPVAPSTATSIAPNRPSVAVPTSAPTSGATGDQFKIQTPEEAFAERRKLQELAGVSKDPYAAVMQRQAAMESRDQAKYAQDPIDRVLGQLSAISTADPTKGAGYALGVSAKAAQEMKDKQTEYRDKKEELGLQFATNMAKEQDARARGDVKGVEDAIAAQKKNKIDLAKVEVDKLGHELNYKASMASTGNAASKLAFEMKQAELMNPYDIKTKEAQARAADANVPSKEEKNKIAEEAVINNRATGYLNSLKPIFTEWQKYTDPLTGVYKLGTPAGNAILQYQKDLQEEAVKAAKENRSPNYPSPPVAVQNIIEKGGFFSKDKTENSLSYGQPAAKPDTTPIAATPDTKPIAAPPKPAAYPDAKLGKDPQGNPAWFVQKDGKYYKVQ